MAQTDCRWFSGYKPCGLNPSCNSSCPRKEVVKTRILMIHLEAIGAVLRSTALLKPIRRKFPQSHITWVTARPSDQLLRNNSLVDRVLTTSSEDLLTLSALEFDVAMVIDKGLRSAGVLKQTRADHVFGFVCDSRTGAVVPATPAADELWNIGLSDQKKFFENSKPETQLIAEALELEYRRDGYEIALSAEEKAESARRREVWGRGDRVVVGLNTGCSTVIPYKKLSIEGHVSLIQQIRSRWGRTVEVVLLGGPEDTVRNQRIADLSGAVLSPTDRGLRDGLVSMDAVDVVVSGDSLGMHMAIALQKWVVAWFGPTCAQEIDLFDRGTKVLSQAPCSPCWKRQCDKSTMCYDLVDHRDILRGIQEGMRWHQEFSSTKLHFGEISSLRDLS